MSESWPQMVKNGLLAPTKKWSPGSIISSPDIMIRLSVDSSMPTPTQAPDKVCWVAICSPTAGTIRCVELTFLVPSM